MFLRALMIVGAFTCLSVTATAQETSTNPPSSIPAASTGMLARGMAMLDGKWAGNETSRKATDAMTTTVESGAFESRMDRKTHTATVTNGDEVFNVRLEPGALVYSAVGREGEQRRRITKFFPVDDDGDWFIAVLYETRFADAKLYSVEEIYRMDGGVYTRMAEATPIDGSGPPTVFRWGSFKKVSK